MVSPSNPPSVEAQPPAVDRPPLPPTNEPSKWLVVPPENITADAWNERINDGSFTSEDVVRAVSKSVELVVRGHVPLLARRESDGSLSLPIQRAGSLFSMPQKRALKKQGLDRLRISPDGREISMVGNAQREEDIVVNPSLSRKIPMGNAAMVPDFAYTPTRPEVKSFFKGKLNFVIFR